MRTRVPRRTLVITRRRAMLASSANGDCSCVGEDSDILPSACRDVCAQQLRNSRPLAANCRVMGCETRGSQRLFPFLR
jgi:hypothetical protein